MKFFPSISFIALLVFSSCDSNTIIKKPANLIPKDKMVEVLSDVYISKSARSLKNNNGDRNINYHSFVYKNHNIDSISFHQSLKYYSSDIKQNEEILKLVKEKIDKQSELITNKKQKKEE